MFLNTANYSAMEIMSRSVAPYLLIQDDDGMRRARRDILESVTRIDETREAAAKQRYRLVGWQLELGHLAVLVTWKCPVSRWKFISGFLPMETMTLYQYLKIAPLLSSDRSGGLVRVYVKLQGIAYFDSASSLPPRNWASLTFPRFPPTWRPDIFGRVMPLTN
jgi:hypothetical protein